MVHFGEIVLLGKTVFVLTIFSMLKIGMKVKVKQVKVKQVKVKQKKSNSAVITKNNSQNKTRLK